MVYRNKRGKIIPDLDKIYETDFKLEYKKYEKLVTNVKEEIKKVAKIKSIVKVALYIVTYISIIVIDLCFNVLDLINEIPIYIRIVRIFIYITLAILFVIEICNFSKNYKRYMTKLYKRKCKKFEIDR